MVVGNRLWRISRMSQQNAEGDEQVRRAYDALPVAIKASITFKEYCWMPSEQRNNLEYRESVVMETYID